MADDRWQRLVADAEGGDVTAGTMFGSKGLRTGRKFFAVWWHEQLVVKLPPDRLRELVDSGQGRPFEPMEGRRMNGWIVLGDRVDWAPVVQEARAHVAAQNA
ncbi:MAG TPA: TfoX/Sxy family protein [Blastococcus sp.]|nr:TfoX/Sxy family protein [Blastococcus sp.]